MTQIHQNSNNIYQSIDQYCSQFKNTEPDTNFSIQKYFSEYHKHIQSQNPFQIYQQPSYITNGNEQPSTQKEQETQSQLLEENPNKKTDLTKRKRNQSHTSFSESLSNISKGSKRSKTTNVTVPPNKRMDLKGWICSDYRNKAVIQLIIDESNLTSKNEGFFVQLYNQLDDESSSFVVYYNNQILNLENQHFLSYNFNDVLLAYFNQKKLNSSESDYHSLLDDIIQGLKDIDKINRKKKFNDLQQKEDLISTSRFFNEENNDSNQVLLYIIFIFKYQNCDISTLIKPTTFCNCFNELFNLYFKQQFKILHFLNFKNNFDLLKFNSQYSYNIPNIIFESFQSHKYNFQKQGEKSFWASVLSGYPSSTKINIISCNNVYNSVKPYRTDYCSDPNYNGQYFTFPPILNDNEFC